MAATAGTAMTIAQAARATGLSPDTLRYYEREDLLLEPVARASSTHRRYGDRDLEWIRLVSRLRGTGMPIRDVRRYAALVREGDGTEADRLQVLRDHRDAVRAHLHETLRHLDAIEHKIALYERAVAGGD